MSSDTLAAATHFDLVVKECNVPQDHQMLWVLAEGQHHPSRYTPSNQEDEAGGLCLTSAWQLPSLKFQMGLLIRVLDKGEGITVICLGIQGDLKNGRGHRRQAKQPTIRTVMG